VTAEDITRAGEAAILLRQGDVLELPVAETVLIADLERPLSGAAIEESAAGGTGIQIVPVASPRVVLLTQTCDLQRTGPGQLFAVVAVVEERTPTDASLAWRGNLPRLAGLPWLSQTAVADLSNVTTIERSLLIGAQRIATAGVHQRAQFSEILGRFYHRPAIPDQVIKALGPLQARVKDKHDRSESAVGRRFNDLYEIRILLEPDVDDPCPDVTLLFLLDKTDLPPLPRGLDVDYAEVDTLMRRHDVDSVSKAIEVTDSTHEIRHLWWAWAEFWARTVRAKASALEGVGEIAIEVWSISEISYERASAAILLDLSYLSTRASD
jgi:hypothetical protein